MGLRGRRGIDDRRRRRGALARRRRGAASAGGCRAATVVRRRRCGGAGLTFDRARFETNRTASDSRERKPSASRGAIAAAGCQKLKPGARRSVGVAILRARAPTRSAAARKDDATTFLTTRKDKRMRSSITLVLAAGAFLLAGASSSAFADKEVTVTAG